MGYLELWARIAQLYSDFPAWKVKMLKRDFQIDNGTDFADFMFKISGVDSITFEETGKKKLKELEEIGKSKNK